MTELMKKIAKKQLWIVAGVYKGEGVSGFDEGSRYAAIDQEDAETQAEKFWIEEMGYTEFSPSFSECIDEVDGFKVVLVEDEQA